MYAGAVAPDRIATKNTSAIEALLVNEYSRDLPRASIPRAQAHLVVRFGPTARRGLDVHAMGARQQVHRKVIFGGQRAIMARLQLGAHETVLGVSAASITDKTVPLEDLWGTAAVERLLDRLAASRTTEQASTILADAIAERVSAATVRRAPRNFVLDAAARLSHANVTAVAAELGVSERHLRRVFRETLGVGPKTFAKLARFHRALHAAREEGQTNWASIAAGAGYYDQAHLIAEFRAIAGVTPRELLGEHLV